MENQDVLDSVAETLEWIMQGGGSRDILFVRTAAERRRTFHFWGQKRLRKAIKAKALDWGLEPLLWNVYAPEALVLYCPRDKSFWTWKYDDDRKAQLRKIGYHWTDIFEPWPVF